MTNLAFREKIMLAVGSLFVLLFLVINFFVSPVIAQKEKLQNGIKVKRAGLTEMLELSSEFYSLRKDTSSIEKKISARKKSFTLFSFLEKAADQAKVKRMIKYMKPSASSSKGILNEAVVEMKLEQISLIQLVDYLKLVESTVNVVFVNRLSIQENGKENGFLDVIMQVKTFNKQ